MSHVHRGIFSASLPGIPEASDGHAQHGSQLSTQILSHSQDCWDPEVVYDSSREFLLSTLRAEENSIEIGLDEPGFQNLLNHKYLAGRMRP